MRDRTGDTVMLQIQDVSYKYQSREVFTLNHVSLTLQDGEMLLLAGRSGCGKSTLIKIISGLVSEDGGGVLQGKILLDGEDITCWPPEKIGRLAGTVYQTPDDQLFAMTVADETGFALENQGLEPEQIRVAVSETLGKVGLDGYERHSIHQLSGGQRQRLALASILITKPRLLILDEPVSQMNPQGVEDFMKLLLRLNREEGISILMIEHRVNELAAYFPRLAIMQEGNIVYDGPTEEAWSVLGQGDGMGVREPQSVKLGRLLRLSALTSDTEATVRRIRQECEIKQEQKEGQEPLVFPPVSGQEKLADRGSDTEPSAEGDGGDWAGSPLPETGSGISSAAVLVRAENLVYRYQGMKVDTLRDLSFTLYKKQITALMGSNGAGKSTLLNLMGGIARPSGGLLLLEGKALQEQLGRIGYLLQESDLMLLADTVTEELAWQNRRMTPEKSVALLRRLRLAANGEDFPLALSKGQRLRVVLGAMLAKEPKLLLLDEPTTGQDEDSLSEITKLLLDFKDQGGSVFICTHDIELASRIADRILLLAKGKILADGDTDTVLSDRKLLRQSGLTIPATLDISEALTIPPCITEKEVTRYVHAAVMGRNGRTSLGKGSERAD